jgi:hypothetical protein
MDFGAAVTGVAEFLDEVSPRQGGQFRETLERVQRGFGFASLHEFFRMVGPEYAMFMSFPDQAIIPDIGLLLEVQDRKRVEDLLQRITRGLGDLPVATDYEYRGRTLRVFKPVEGRGSAEFKFKLRPTVVLLDEHLLVTPWPFAAKRFLAELDAGQPRLRDAPDFKKLLSRLGSESALDGSQSLTYIDTARLFGFVSDNAAVAAQLMSSTDIVRLDAWPINVVVREHLFGTLSLGKTDDERGVTGESYSSLGVLSGYAGIAAMMGAVVATSVMPYAEIKVPPTPVQTVAEAVKLDPTFKARQDLEVLLGLVLDYSSWEGDAPKEADWPGFLTKGSKNHPSPYHQAPPINDPWGFAYKYQLLPNGGFLLLSLGADGEEGGKGESSDIKLTLRR